MNIKGILRMVGNILLMQVVFFIPSIFIALYDHDYNVSTAFIQISLGMLLLVVVLRFFTRRAKTAKPLYAREGFLIVSICWVIVSLFGALPFFISGEIPNYLDALFETASGFTTTGASILNDVESMSRALLFWRSLTHWLGGMGILVFILALIPAAKGAGESLYVLRAESPGPSIDKLVPKIRHHAAILYGIYIAMTLLCFLLLLPGGMPIFDNICITLGTAGTGGYGIRADSAASYSTYSQIIITIFMLLFGVNFNIYFLLLLRRFKDILKDEELRVYLSTFLLSSILITWNTLQGAAFSGKSFLDSAFTVSSIMSSTGYSTANFDLWPEFSRTIIVLLMVVGASAGSTGGGVKVSRVLILLKSAYRELRKLLHPRSVVPVRLNNQVVSENVIHGAHIYSIFYIAILSISLLILSLDNFSMDTNVSATISCLSNIGPGLGSVAPIESYAKYSSLSKIALTIDMLIGRLEIFPFLLLLHYKTWKRGAF